MGEIYRWVNSTLTLSMPGRAQSQTRKKRAEAKKKEYWMSEAVKLYLENSSLGLREAIDRIQARCLRETGGIIKLDKTTLSRRAKGQRSIYEFNASKRWLTPEQENIVIDYAISMARRGWPLTHRRLQEHVEEIARAYYGDQFPESGVGRCWMTRFVERHRDRIRAHWSHALDNSRARAGNPHTKKAFFDLLEEVLAPTEGDGAIPPELIYGADETGIQKGVGVREYVLGPSDGSIVHQQRSGDRENITVIVTICADGTSLPPAVIFKGEGFQVRWEQDNPLKAS